MDWGSFTLAEDDQLEITINENVRNIIIKNGDLSTQQFPNWTGLQIFSYILQDIFISSEKTSHLKERHVKMNRVKKSAMNTINKKFPINDKKNEKFSMSFDKDFKLIIENEHK